MIRCPEHVMTRASELLLLSHVPSSCINQIVCKTLTIKLKIERELNYKFVDNNITYLASL